MIEFNPPWKGPPVSIVPNHYAGSIVIISRHGIEEMTKQANKGQGVHLYPSENYLENSIMDFLWAYRQKTSLSAQQISYYVYKIPMLTGYESPSEIRAVGDKLKNFNKAIEHLRKDEYIQVTEIG